MPRAARLTSTQLVQRALPLFWAGGFDALSVDALIRGTEGSRQALYGAFGDKRALLLACIALYRETIVAPAVAPMQREGAGLAEIAAYFARQIAGAEAAGLPGPGCLLGNLATELAPRDEAVAALVAAHLAGLEAAFLHALRGAAAGRNADADADALEGWAEMLVALAQGLWSISRLVSEASALRRSVAAQLALIEGALGR